MLKFHLHFLLAICCFCILSDLHFVVFCILSNLHFVKFVFCQICILSSLHFVLFEFCYICIMSGYPFAYIVAIEESNIKTIRNIDNSNINNLIKTIWAVWSQDSAKFWSQDLELVELIWMVCPYLRCEERISTAIKWKSIFKHKI